MDKEKALAAAGIDKLVKPKTLKDFALPIAEINLKEGFDDIEPLNDYVLVKVTTKSTFELSPGGVIVAKGDSDTMPCLQVVSVSEDAKNEDGEPYDKVKPGDVIEVAEVTRLTYFIGTNLEKFSWIDKKYIAGVYRKQIND